MYIIYIYTNDFLYVQQNSQSSSHIFRVSTQSRITAWLLHNGIERIQVPEDSAGGPAPFFVNAKLGVYSYNLTIDYDNYNIK